MLFEQGMYVTDIYSGRTGVVVVEDAATQMYLIDFEDGDNGWIFEGELVHAEFGESFEN